MLRALSAGRMLLLASRARVCAESHHHTSAAGLTCSSCSSGLGSSSVGAVAAASAAASRPRHAVATAAAAAANSWSCSRRTGLQAALLSLPSLPRRWPHAAADLSCWPSTHQQWHQQRQLVCTAAAPPPGAAAEDDAAAASRQPQQVPHAAAPPNMQQQQQQQQPMGAANSSSLQQQDGGQQQQGVAAAAPSRQPSFGRRPRQPRRGSSASKAPSDGGDAAGVKRRGRPPTKQLAAVASEGPPPDSTNGMAPSSNGAVASSNGTAASSNNGATANGTSSSSSSSNGKRALPPLRPLMPLGEAAGIKPPDMALRGAFVARGPALVAPHPPSTPHEEALWAELLEWAHELGVPASTLADWGAGLARAQHPLHGGEVTVLALPYVRGGQLVDVRHLHVALQADGAPAGREAQLLGSWLAVGGAHPFLDERRMQGKRRAVFVGSELDALLLSSMPALDDAAIIALPRQSPQWHSDIQQQQQQQQQQDQHTAARLEDPRLRLAQLSDDLAQLRRQHEVGMRRAAVTGSGSDGSSGGGGGAWGEEAAEGLVVSDAGQSSSSISGLQLLLKLPAADKHCHAVIAMHDSPDAAAAADELAELLDKVLCRHAQWPSPPSSSPAEHEASLAAAAAAAAAGNGTHDAAAANAVQAQLRACATLRHLLGPAAAPPASAGGGGSAGGAPQQLGWSCVSLRALLGADALAECLAGAYVWPISGLERFADHALDMLSYWDTTDMGTLAHSTGWPALDEYYKVSPGEVTLVTGVPNSGKSEWLDALAVNLAEQQGWRFAVCSMEKRPRDHARQLLEKRARRPLLRAAYAEGGAAMEEEELCASYAWLCDHFYVIAAGEGAMPSIDWVLDKAKAARIQYGISGLIIDPYNELDPTRPPSLKEHEAVNALMARLRKFARDNQVHCWLVAHPRQFGNMWSGQRPGLQDISGGANFSNKADNGIVVHRDWSKLRELQARAGAAAGGGRKAGRGGSNGAAAAAAGAAGEPELSEEERRAAALAECEVQIIVEKVRNKTTGCKGDCVLYYHRVTGRYLDPRHPDDDLSLLTGGSSSSSSNGSHGSNGSNGAAAAAPVAAGDGLVLTHDGTPLAPSDDTQVLQQAAAAARAAEEQLAAAAAALEAWPVASVEEHDALHEAGEAASDAASGLVT